MISLKSIKGIALVTAAFGASLALSTGSIHAADTDSSSSSSSSTFTSATSGSSSATGTTTADFTVTAGDDSSNTTTNPNTDSGALQLTSAPSFSFGTINVSTIVNGGTVASSSVTNNLSVKDYRGAATSTGDTPEWNVTASMSKFKDTSDATNTNELTATISGLTTTNGTLSGTAIGSSATNVFSSSSNGNDTKGIGTASATIGSATLGFSDSNSPVSGHSYSSTVTWTLSNTASN